jgi:hypothetical protein
VYHCQVGRGSRQVHRLQLLVDQRRELVHVRERELARARDRAQMAQEREQRSFAYLQALRAQLVVASETRWTVATTAGALHAHSRWRDQLLEQERGRQAAWQSDRAASEQAQADLARSAAALAEALRDRDGVQAVLDRRRQQQGRLLERRAERELDELVAVRLRGC